MRLLGVILLAICPIYIGSSLSKSLSLRRSELTQAVELIERLKTEISYNAKETGQLVRELKDSECFDKLLFIAECNLLMKKNIPFPKAWEQAVKNSQNHFEQEDLEQLMYLSRVLGATDIQGQISSLELTKQNLLNSLRQAEQICHTKGKMYRSLGVLSGIAVAILTI